MIVAIPIKKDHNTAREITMIARRIELNYAHGQILISANGTLMMDGDANEFFEFVLQANSLQKRAVNGYDN